MKKLVLGICCCLLSFAAISQVTTKEKIHRSTFIGLINAHTTNNEVLISWVADDMEYDHIQKYYTVFSGTPEEFTDYLNQIIEFADQYDKDASVTILDWRINVDRDLGAKQLTIYEIDAVGGLGGYRQFTPGQIQKIKKKFTQWANKKGIDI